MERMPWVHMAKFHGDFYPEPDSSESLYPSLNKGLSYVIKNKTKPQINWFCFLLRVEIGTMHRNNTEVDYRLV